MGIDHLLSLFYRSRVIFIAIFPRSEIVYSFQAAVLVFFVLCNQPPPCCLANDTSVTCSPSLLNCPSQVFFYSPGKFFFLTSPPLCPAFPLIHACLSDSCPLTSFFFIFHTRDPTARNPNVKIDLNIVQHFPFHSFLQVSLPPFLIVVFLYQRTTRFFQTRAWQFVLS